jgi:hypothetical protein
MRRVGLVMREVGSFIRIEAPLWSDIGRRVPDFIWQIGQTQQVTPPSGPSRRCSKTKQGRSSRELSEAYLSDN